MKARHFDDFKAGDRFQSAPFEVTEQQIIEFAKEFDPQKFHVDPAIAEKTMFKGLIASGWHTASISMRLFVQTPHPFAEGAIGLGVDELRCPSRSDQATFCESKRRLLRFGRRGPSPTAALCASGTSPRISAAKLCRRCSRPRSSRAAHVISDRCLLTCGLAIDRFHRPIGVTLACDSFPRRDFVDSGKVFRW